MRILDLSTKGLQEKLATDQLFRADRSGECFVKRNNRKLRCDMAKLFIKIFKSWGTLVQFDNEVFGRLKRDRQNTIEHFR